MQKSVNGEGPLPAVGMIVGEAPGKTEVAVGRPFVGASGSLLNSALAALGIPREELYITNVVKFMPLDEAGKIRRPTPDEIQDGRATLEREVMEASPGAILLLGRTAVDFFLPGYHLGSKEIFIQPKLLVGKTFYTAWHPAYVLRNPREAHNWENQIRPFAAEVKAHLEKTVGVTGADSEGLYGDWRDRGFGGA